METLIALRGRDLLRVKGLLDVAGCRGPVVVQFVQHLAHPPVELEAWPSADRATRLVFITRGIDEQAVRDLFDAVRALADCHRADLNRHPCMGLGLSRGQGLSARDVMGARRCFLSRGELGSSRFLVRPRTFLRPDRSLGECAGCRRGQGWP